MRTAFVLLAAIVLAATAQGQIYTYPAAPLDSPTTLEVRLVDRYALPVSGVELTGRSSPYGPFRSIAAAPFGSRPFQAKTDDDGRAQIELEVDEIAWILARRTGFAPTPLYPLFPGWSYEHVLDLGTTVYVECRDPEGQPLAQVDLELFWNAGARLPGAGFEAARGAGPIQRGRTDALGMVTFYDVPRGSFELVGHDAELGSGTKIFQVASAFGVEAVFGLSPLVLVLAPGARHGFQVLDGPSGAPLPNVELLVHRRGLHVAPALSRHGSGSELELVADLADVGSLEFLAPGYVPSTVPVIDFATGRTRTDLPRVVRLTPLQLDRLTLDAPPEGEPMDVFSPAGDVVRSSPVRWRSRGRLSVGETLEVEVPKDVGVFAVAVRDRRITGFWRRLAGEPTTAFLPSARLDLRFTVEGRPAVGALIRTTLARADGQALRPCSDLAPGLTIVPTAPDGWVRLQGLLPGHYDAEPHLHFTVFTDALVSIEAPAGELVSREVPIRSGRKVRGTLLQRESGEPVTSGVIVLSCAEARLYDTRFPLDEHGRFVLAGLAPDRSYTLSYRSVGEDGAFARPGEPLGALSPPLPEDIELELP